MKARVMNCGWNKKIMYVYKKKDDSALTDNVLPGETSICQLLISLAWVIKSPKEFSFPNSSHLQNLISQKDNLLNETNSEVVTITKKRAFLSYPRTLDKNSDRKLHKKNKGQLCQ